MRGAGLYVKSEAWSSVRQFSSGGEVAPQDDSQIQMTAVGSRLTFRTLRFSLFFSLFSSFAFCVTAMLIVCSVLLILRRL